MPHLTITTDVIKLVASILPIVALFQVFDSLSAVSGGILRARGKQVRFTHFLWPGVELTSEIVYRRFIEYKVRLHFVHIF